MESTRLVQSVARFCGQQGWTNSLRAEEEEEALGEHGSVRPHFHFPTSKKSTVVFLYHATVQCGTSTRYQASVPFGRVP